MTDGIDPLQTVGFPAFQTGLRELGYVEGKTLTIEWRFADGEYGRLPALANELIQSRIDVLVVDSTPGVEVAHPATTSIPIVMISVGDPVASGLIASLSRPGGNITGLSNVVATSARNTSSRCMSPFRISGTLRC